jgi:hypothetical protein
MLGFPRNVEVILNVALVLVTAGFAVGGDAAPNLQLKTTAFRPGGTIPTPFTCSGENISPALSWGQPPPGTKSFVLVMDDPDAPAGTWVHWIVYNLPPSARGLPGHVPAGNIAGGGKQGVNDFPTEYYSGPCPPPGKAHRYFFHLYALDTTLDLRAPVHRRDVDAAMRGHVLAQGELIGTFAR